MEDNQDNKQYIGNIIRFIKVNWKKKFVVFIEKKMKFEFLININLFDVMNLQVCFDV